jgi:hypothetical protein
MNYLDIPIFVWDHSGVGEIVLLKWECEAQKVSQGWSRLVKPSQTTFKCVNRAFFRLTSMEITLIWRRKNCFAELGFSAQVGEPGSADFFVP